MPSSGMWHYVDICKPTFRRNVSPPSSGWTNLRERNRHEQVVTLQVIFIITVSAEEIGSSFPVGIVFLSIDGIMYHIPKFRRNGEVPHEIFVLSFEGHF
jgi:hypothetical protein